ncbi:hypothetical protein GCM10010442_46770 [Kitasatospora kifunensis]
MSGPQGRTVQQPHIEKATVLTPRALRPYRPTPEALPVALHRLGAGDPGSGSRRRVWDTVTGAFLERLDELGTARVAESEGNEVNPLLATPNVYRTRGLAARPWGWRRMVGQGQDLRKQRIREPRGTRGAAGRNPISANGRL